MFTTFNDMIMMTFACVRLW